jgi:hypothetical protein
MLMFLIASYTTSHLASSNPPWFSSSSTLASNPFCLNLTPRINPYFYKLWCAWIVFFCNLWFYQILELDYCCEESGCWMPLWMIVVMLVTSHPHYESWQSKMNHTTTMLIENLDLTSTIVILSNFYQNSCFLL